MNFKQRYSLWANTYFCFIPTIIYGRVFKERGLTICFLKFHYSIVWEVDKNDYEK